MRRTVLAMAVAACMTFLGCGDSMPSVPNTPDGTVTAVASALADGKPAVLWSAMPASYQKDVTELVQQFAANMDAEVYNKGWDLAKKLGAVLKAKKDFILANEMLAQAKIDPKEAAAKWDSVVGIVDALTSSQLASLASLKSVNIPGLLSTTGGKVMQCAAELSKLTKEDPYNTEFVGKLKGVTAEKVKVSDDGKEATIKMTAPDKYAKDGKSTEELKMVSVEGKWVPKEMADDWKNAMAEAKKNLDSMSKDTIGKSKPQILAMMGAIEPILDQMLKAETKEQFDMALGQGMMMIMGGAMGPSSGPPMPMPPGIE